MAVASLELTDPVRSRWEVVLHGGAGVTRIESDATRRLDAVSSDESTVLAAVDAGYDSSRHVTLFFRPLAGGHTGCWIVAISGRSLRAPWPRTRGLLTGSQPPSGGRRTGTVDVVRRPGIAETGRPHVEARGLPDIRGPGNGVDGPGSEPASPPSPEDRDRRLSTALAPGTKL